MRMKSLDILIIKRHESDARTFEKNILKVPALERDTSGTLAPLINSRH